MSRSKPLRTLECRIYLTDLLKFGKHNIGGLPQLDEIRLKLRSSPYIVCGQAHRIDAPNSAFAANPPYLVCDVSTQLRFGQVTRETIRTRPIKSKIVIHLGSALRRYV